MDVNARPRVLTVFLRGIGATASIAVGQGFDDVSNWAAYDPGGNGVGSDPDGYSGAIFDGRYVYFTPFLNGTSHHGEVLRYDTEGSFSDAGSWTTYDAGDHGVGNDPDGYLDGVFDGRYVYFVPDFNGSGFHSEALRYDTLGDFLDAASWSAYDPTNDGVGSNSASFAGGVFDGQHVYFAPNNDGQQYGEVLRYDAGQTEPVPAVSEWGLAVMALLMLSVGTAVLVRARSRRESCETSSAVSKTDSQASLFLKVSCEQKGCDPRRIESTPFLGLLNLRSRRMHPATNVFGAMLLGTLHLLTCGIGAQLSFAEAPEYTDYTLSADQVRGIDRLFSFIEDSAPGCAVGVVREGRLVFARGYGLANLEWKIPITSETVFDIASTSKQITATAVLLLDQDGVLDLGDDIRRWLPEMPDYGTVITIQQLLNHTSGIRDYETLLTLSGRPSTNIFQEKDGVALVARQKALEFTPGTKYRYSNSGYLLLATIINRASGQSLSEFCAERIFLPLGMQHTTVWDDWGTVISKRATAYGPSQGGFRTLHFLNDEAPGAGGVHTSVEELALWDGNFYSPKVGGDALLRRLQTPGHLANGETVHYAAGLEIGEYRGVATVRHGGAQGGFRSELLRFPRERTSVICLCNREDVSSGTLAERVAEVVLHERLPLTAEEADVQPEAGEVGERAHPQVSDAELEVATQATPPRIRVNRGRPRERIATHTVTKANTVDYVGNFFSHELDVEYRISEQDGGLSLHLPVFEPVSLRFGAKDEAFFSNWVLAFERDSQGRVRGFCLDTVRVSSIEFARRDKTSERDKQSHSEVNP